MPPAQLKNFPAVWPLAMLGFYTGMRQQEIANLRVQDFNLKAATLRVTDTENHNTKTGESRTLPIPEIIVGMLAEMQPSDSGLFFQSARKKPHTLNTLSKLWEKPFMAAKAKNLLPEDFTAKVSRATFITLAHECGVSEVHRKKMSGHKPSTVERAHYLKVTIEQVRQEMAKFWQSEIFKNRKSPKNKAAA